VLVCDYLSLGVFSGVFVLEGYFRHLMSKDFSKFDSRIMSVFQVGIIIFIKLLVGCDN